VRAVVQRVESADVAVGGESVGRIAQGLLVFVGVAAGDASADVLRLADKLVHLRVFEDVEGKLNRSVLEVGGEVCIVSQFTLLGDCRKGRRPSYHQAAAPAHARALVEELVVAVTKQGVGVATGRFREHMRVSLVNVGPVTLLLDTSGDF